MKEPIRVDLVDCLTIQEDLLARFGGLSGLRIRGLLESALHRPLQVCSHGSPDVFELAYPYAAGIMRNHPLLDGNKRAGFMVAALFLEINGHHFHAPEEEVVLQTIGLAAGEVSETDYAWLRASCVEAKDLTPPFAISPCARCRLRPA